MNDIQRFKVGDKIVDYCQVYKIFKIKKDVGFNGKKENCIFYKPYFKTDKSQSLVCSIPEGNINKANVRKPVSKKKINETLKFLGKKPSEKININIVQAASYFKENNPLETAHLLKILWLEKQDKNKSMSTRKKTIYQNAMRHLMEEISVVQKIGLKKARKKIKRRLRKSYLEKEEKENNK